MKPFRSILPYLDQLWDDLAPDERTALADVQVALKEAGPGAEALAEARQWLADLRPLAVRLLRTGPPGKAALLVVLWMKVVRDVVDLGEDQELINRLRTLIASIAQQIHTNALPITTRLPHTPDLAQTSLWSMPSNQVARVALEALQDAAEGAPSWAEEHGIPTYTRRYARNTTQMSLTLRGQSAATLSSTL
jgi:hypothetical protein